MWYSPLNYVARLTRLEPGSLEVDLFTHGLIQAQLCHELGVCYVRIRKTEKVHDHCGPVVLIILLFDFFDHGFFLFVES